MKRLLIVSLICVALFAEARGGSSSGGGRGGFSSAPRVSAPAPQRAATPPPPVANRGGFNSAQRPTTAPPRTTTTTTTTVQRSRYVSGGGVGYGGMGMGYSYSNGLLTGMLIGNMLHPHNTVMYAGPGMYANNALLYPDGRVVNQQGVHVGNYVNNSFIPVTGGVVVAQTVPHEVAPQPVVIKDNSGQVLAFILAGMLLVIVFILLIAIIV